MTYTCCSLGVPQVCQLCSQNGGLWRCCPGTHQSATSASWRVDLHSYHALSTQGCTDIFCMPFTCLRLTQDLLSDHELPPIPLH
jgi:hypothetical protein